jgi:hypothetical protein
VSASVAWSEPSSYRFCTLERMISHGNLSPPGSSQRSNLILPSFALLRRRSNSTSTASSAIRLQNPLQRGAIQPLAVAGPTAEIVANQNRAAEMGVPERNGHGPVTEKQPTPILTFFCRTWTPISPPVIEIQQTIWIVFSQGTMLSRRRSRRALHRELGKSAFRARKGANLAAGAT